ncbi:hypothetical protein BKA65DRAFT_576549 [Rhexocercosporidium sp. MPI-PUGE-AT-0058]|nr:hypothetical protein BKA65DRAFT_576549 [Rhexocercosporidium sp. MPI-PUGE-AT-0058]
MTSQAAVSPAIPNLSLCFPQNKDRKRKRSQEDELTLPSSSPSQSPIENTIGENAARKELRWPKEYFESESNINHLLTRKKSSLSLRGKQSEADSAAPSSTIPSDQKPREAKNRNEAKSLAIRGAKRLKTLIESVNKGWDNSIALTKPRPQPDYTVGFKQTAFTEDQLKKIQPYISDFSEMSLFISIYYIYFPFLICEVKCGATALNVADRQNTHSITIAVRGIIELFRLIKREKVFYREILAFSISHNHWTVRIYGHYLVLDGKKTTFYRHSIRKFSFTELDGKKKWTAYKFTKNVYDI